MVKPEHLLLILHILFREDMTQKLDAIQRAILVVIKKAEDVKSLLNTDPGLTKNIAVPSCSFLGFSHAMSLPLAGHTLHPKILETNRLEQRLAEKGPCKLLVPPVRWSPVRRHPPKLTC